MKIIKKQLKYKGINGDSSTVSNRLPQIARKTKDRQCIKRKQQKFFQN